MSQSDRAPAYSRRRSPVLTSDYRKGKRPPNAGLKLPPEVYTPQEIERLMRHAGRGASGYRNRALIALQYRSCLRAGEALALRMADLDFDVGLVRVMHGKGDKHRVVHLDSRTAALLELWISGPRARLRLPPRGLVFVTFQHGEAGHAYRYSDYAEALKRAARRAGIEKRMHTHGLRHSGAFELVREGVDLVTISDVLGHEDLGTTQTYVRHHFPLDRIRRLSAREWPATNGAAPGPTNGAAPRNS